MTKNVKTKKVIATAGILSAAVLCFGGAQVAKTVSNGNVGTAIVRAYADEYYDVFQAQIAILDSIDFAAITTQADYNKYVTAYRNAQDVLGRVAGQATQEEMDIYQAADANVSEVAVCFDYMSVTLPAKLAGSVTAGTALYWSDKDAYDAVIEKIEDDTSANYLGDFAKAYIQNVFVNYADVKTDADNEFARLEVAVQGAIDMIGAIEYVGKVDSEPFIEDAATALEDIYSIDYNELPAAELTAFRTYITNLADYEDAVSQHQTILDDCEAFDAGIVELYEKFTVEGGDYYDQYYTYRDAITAKKADYDALNQPNDDRTTLITEYAKLDELVNTLNDILGAKTSAEADIAVIPAVYDYTRAYIGYVEAARESYNLLPADLQASGDVALEQNLFDAEEAILADKNEVEDLIADVLALIDMYNEGDAGFSAAVNNAANTRAALEYAKQLADFDAAVVDPAYEGKDNCKDLLAHMQTKRASLNATVTPVINAINAIGALDLNTNPTIGDKITTAEGLYADLTSDLERNSVYNYATLTAAREWFDEETAAKQEWADAVAAIAGIVTTDDIDAFAAVEATYEEFDPSTKTVIQSNPDTFNYDIYEGLLGDRDGLLIRLEDTKDMMAALSNDLAVICADPNAFEANLLGIAAMFEGFDESVRERYFTADGADYELKYANYVEAQDLYDNVVELVCKIIALGGGDPAGVTMIEYDGILEDLAEYEALADEYKDVIDNQGAATIGGVDYASYKDRLDAAKEVIDQKKADRDAWIDSVYALAGTVEKADWADNLYNVDLDALQDVNDARLAFDEDGDAAYLAEADADLATIGDIANQRVTDLVNAIDALPDPLTDADIPTLRDIKATYDKLHATQQAGVTNYDDFLVKYNTYVTSSSFDELIDALYENVVTNGDYTTQVPVNVAILREIYKNLTPAAQALVTKYEKLDEIDTAYESYDGEILDLTSVNTAVKALIEVNGAAIAGNATAIAANAYSIDAAEADIQTLFGNVDTITADITALAVRVTALETAVANLEAALDTAKTDLQAAIDTVADNLDTAKTDLQAAIDTVQGNLDTVEATLNTAKTDLQAAIDAVAGDLNTAEANLQAAIDVVAAAIDGLDGDLDAAVADLEAADQALKDELIAKINELKNQMNKSDNAIEKRVKTLEIESYILIAAVVLLAAVDVVFLILRKKA